MGVATPPPARATRAPERLRLLPWREVVLPWLVSRIYSVALIFGAASIGSGGIRASGFTKWDGQWYLDIARFGYGPEPVEGVQTRWPFFPGFPAVIRVIRELGLPDRGTAVVLNQVIFLIALAGVWRIARRYTNAGPARLAVWSLALFPGAFIFSMVYPSSIWLALSVWAFIFVDEHRDLAAAVLVTGAALVRPNGVVLAVALVIVLRSWRRVLVVCAPSVAAVALWCVACYHWTGDALVFLTSKEGWPEVTVKAFVLAPFRESCLTCYHYVYPHLFLAAAALGALFLMRRRLPAAWSVFTVLYLLPSLGLGMVGLGRYANECFPPFVAAGQVLERWSTRVQAALLGASAAGLVLFAFVVARYELVP
jgi:Dolichyl-phosphate-mannose-protein mannosyltransferase